MRPGGATLPLPAAPSDGKRREGKQVERIRTRGGSLVIPETERCGGREPGRSQLFLRSVFFNIRAPLKRLERVKSPKSYARGGRVALSEVVSSFFLLPPGAFSPPQTRLLYPQPFFLGPVPEGLVTPNATSTPSKI